MLSAVFFHAALQELARFDQTASSSEDCSRTDLFKCIRTFRFLLVDILLQVGQDLEQVGVGQVACHDHHILFIR